VPRGVSNDGKAANNALVAGCTWICRIGIVDAARDPRAERCVAEELAEQLDPVGALHDETEQRGRFVDRRIAAGDPAARDDPVVRRACPYRAVRDDPKGSARRDRKPAIDYKLVGERWSDLEQ
jgi:hypothetical protein